MKHPYTSLCLLFLPLISCGPSPWPTYAIDNRVTVQTPGRLVASDTTALKKFAPKGTFRKGALATVASLTTKDEYGSYRVIRADGANPASKLNWQAGPQGYYEECIEKLIKSYKAKLLARSPFSTSAGKGIEIKFTVPYKFRPPASGEVEAVGYYRILLIGKVAYMLQFNPPYRQKSQDTTGTAHRQRFFNSITVKP